MRAVLRVPRLPPFFLGGRPWRGGVWVLPLERCAPPPRLLFFPFFFGVGRWLSRSLVSWSLSPDPFSSGPRCLVFVCCCSFCVVCVRVFWVSFPSVSRCPRLGVAGFGWVVPLGGGFRRLLWCWWALWWLWAVLAPPPPPCCFLSGAGGLPVPPSAFPVLAHGLVGILCDFPV